MSDGINNRLAGTVLQIRDGSVVTHLHLKAGGQVLKSIVPHDLATGLQIGDKVVLLIKPTEIAIERARGQGA